MDGSYLDAIGAIAEAIESNKEFLTDLDREIGDADHGINLSRGFRAVMAKLKTEPVNDLSSGLKKIAMTLISTVGGASGPLYGTAFLRGAKAAEGKTTVDKELAAQILRAAIDGVEERGKAVPGDKTMVDALEPAYDAFRDSVKEEKPFLDCLKAACDAAEKGVEYTKTISARKGRASYLGERSIGHQDPGATSVAIILRALTDYYQKIS